MLCLLMYNPYIMIVYCFPGKLIYLFDTNVIGSGRIY